MPLDWLEVSYTTPSASSTNRQSPLTMRICSIERQGI
jgi:hypothetical protein